MPMRPGLLSETRQLTPLLTAAPTTMLQRAPSRRTREFRLALAVLSLPSQRWGQATCHSVPSKPGSSSEGGIQYRSESGSWTSCSVRAGTRFRSSHACQAARSFRWR
ncbi:MAG: hypothetical protein JWQ56_519, partial [Pseudarthrobacter sp.]|nr:hypothetical protein [Pseudarthrobacter sp.]